MKFCYVTIALKFYFRHFAKREIFVRLTVVWRGPASRPGGRASPESGRIIALSFEESYCRTMSQVIDRHRTERHDISKVARAVRKRWPRAHDARNARGTPARGNSRENLTVFRPSSPADSDAIFLDHGHELPTWSDQGR